MLRNQATQTQAPQRRAFERRDMLNRAGESGMLILAAVIAGINLLQLIAFVFVLWLS